MTIRYVHTLFRVINAIWGLGSVEREATQKAKSLYTVTHTHIIEEYLSPNLHTFNCKKFCNSIYSWRSWVEDE